MILEKNGKSKVEKLVSQEWGTKFNPLGTQTATQFDLTLEACPGISF